MNGRKTQKTKKEEGKEVRKIDGKVNEKKECKGEESIDLYEKEEQNGEWVSKGKKRRGDNGISRTAL